MDIFKFGKEYNYACDYYDHKTGRIYHLQEYERCKKLGLPTNGVAVTEDGKIIEYIQEPK